MLNSDLRSGPFVWPIQMQGLRIRCKTAANFIPLHALEVGFALGGEVDDAVMNEVDLSIDIARR
ncbi:hypothetical protein AKJ29_07425 [Aliiroseovarius crassostreae]|uniref:Uncharacterized protein n=2 Tax=Aliiroseovarius crassostreae TaxID=154981 RepID=A0A0P7KFB1_9RHOB|nr:hypothetical protein AKJ29_07425 [Aliiroseovarius crassostreae]